MNVELGAGGRAAPGFLAVDLNPRRCDVVAAAANLPFRDASITGLRAIDLLEHVSYRETDAVLAEWARVLAPKCEAYIQVPCASTIMRWYVANDDRLLKVGPGVKRTHLAGAQWRLLGGHDDGERVDTAAGDPFYWNAHFSLWSLDSLTLALDAAGFTVIRYAINPFPNLQVTARRNR